MADGLPGNAASEMAARFMNIINSGQLDGLGPLIAPSIRRADRRRGVSAPDICGRDEYLAWLETSVSVGLVAVDAWPVHTRGDSLALMHATWGTGDGAEMEFLFLIGLDDKGRTVYGCQYDLEDQAAAIEDMRLLDRTPG